VVVTVLLGAASRAGEIAWESDVDAAWRAAVAQQRPVLLFVTRANCRYCVEMKQKTFRDPDVAECIGQGFVPVAVDAARIEELVKHLGLAAYPTTLIISPQAQVIDRMQGFLPAERLLPRLERAAPHLATRTN
jgi:uncharacterized protein YyaL (SSP411 family)